MVTSTRILYLTTLFFLILLLAWVGIFFSGEQDLWTNHTFGFIYGGFSIWGAIWGIFTARSWGGHKSLIGKGLLCLAIGLLLQGFGQYSFWIYNYFLKIEVPYPGVPDIGYFGTIPFYILGGYLFAKAAGAKHTLHAYSGKIQAVLIPIGMVVLAYMLFLRDYDFSSTPALKVFFDFGYPIGQAIYTSLAILTYSLSMKVLGGKMRIPVLLITCAFVAQFLADYIFLYFHDLYFPASFIDLFYLVAYFIMTIAILLFKQRSDELAKAE